MTDSAFKVWQKCFRWLNYALPHKMCVSFTERNMADFIWVSAMVRCNADASQLDCLNFMSKAQFFIELLATAYEAKIVTDNEFVIASTMDPYIPYREKKIYLN